MKGYVWLTFAFMGWGYYEMSGGADFVPEQRQMAEVSATATEAVTRSSTPTLLSLSASNVAASETVVVEAAAQVIEPQVIEEPEVVEVAAPVVEPKLDLREVAGSRVNMRIGPGTGYDVITTLDGGTKLEVLEVNEDGWANVSTVDRGIEGWMAERLLTAPET